MWRHGSSSGDGERELAGTMADDDDEEEGGWLGCKGARGVEGGVSRGNPPPPIGGLRRSDEIGAPSGTAAACAPPVAGVDSTLACCVATAERRSRADGRSRSDRQTHGRRCPDGEASEASSAGESSSATAVATRRCAVTSPASVPERAEPAPWRMGSSAAPPSDSLGGGRSGERRLRRAANGRDGRGCAA